MPISKLVRSAIPHSRATYFVLRCASSDKRGSNSSSGDKPRLLCPSSGNSDNPGAPTIYDSRKLGHNLSTNSVKPYFETLPDIPTGVFRCTAGEILGRGAGKCAYYQNPEYFSYHHMSFYDFNIALRKYRQPCPQSGRKPN